MLRYPAGHGPRVTELKSFVRAGRNVWRVERADRFALIVDADDYFRHARSAMLQARKRIMLIGWDFDARISLSESGDSETPEAPEKVGDFIYWLVEQNPELEIYLLRWDLGALKALLRGSTIFTLLKWMRHPRIHTRLDGCHPPGASHHQKIVVIDDMMAFCGGIDMTGDRWDTREHRDHDSRRKRPTGRAYGPWHDATSALDGPVAAALGEHSRERWRRAGGGTLPPVKDGMAGWPKALKPDFTAVEVGIARTWPDWAHYPEVDEVERLYVDMIAAAKRTIYAESQYFASRAIAEALCKRLEEEDGPEIAIVNPVTSNGWLQHQAMDSARARLVEFLRRTRHGKDRLRIYHPVTRDGEPIYVHAKVLIVDDRAIRVGSSNFNNRSMRLDTECDVVVDAGRAGNDGCIARIAAIRANLLAEHLGTTPARVSKTIAARGLISAVEQLRGKGRTLVPYHAQDLTAVSAWLADNELLDPEGPGAAIERIGQDNLVRRLAQRLSR